MSFVGSDSTEERERPCYVSRKVLHAVTLPGLSRVCPAVVPTRDSFSVIFKCFSCGNYIVNILLCSLLPYGSTAEGCIFCDL